MIDTNLTLNMLLEAVAKIEKLIDEEPFAIYMRAHGFEPKDGDMMCLAEDILDNKNIQLPSYVNVSKFLSPGTAVFIRTGGWPNNWAGIVW